MTCTTFASPRFSSASPCSSSSLHKTFRKLQHSRHFSLDSLSSSESNESVGFRRHEHTAKSIDSPTMIVPFMRHHTRSWDRDDHFPYKKRSVSEESDRMSASQENIFTRGLSRISRRKKKQKSLQSSLVSQQQPSFEASLPPSFLFPMPEKKGFFGRRMDQIRKSLRFTRRRNRSNDTHLDSDGGSKSEQWQPDEAAVRASTCFFNVKYLGAIEVFESRGMTTCEGALKSLKKSPRKPVRAVLSVSGDGIRVSEKEGSLGLLVDQTIEKVSFCAPDRTSDKGFAYICRDGTSRRWMCHGFHALEGTGERLSHAVGCAFSICLEKKKKRDEETAAAGDESTPTGQRKGDVFHPNWDDKGECSSSSAAGPSSSSSTSAQRSNPAYQSFRKDVSIADRYLDPQSVIINEVPASSHSDEMKTIAKPRPTSNPALLQRQGSLRAPDMPSTSDQFKRNLSLRQPEVTRERKSFGTTLYNQPILEADEDPLGLGIKPSVPTSSNVNPVSKNGLDGLDLNWKAVPAPIVGLNANGDFASWPSNPPTASAPINRLQQQFDDIRIGVGSSGESTPTVSSTGFSAPAIPVVPPAQPTADPRSKADKWIDDVFRVSMSKSPTSSTSLNTPSSSFSVLPKSGPPPAHAPPPLPVRQAVSNGSPSMYQSTSARDSPASSINWNASPNPQQMAQIPANPVDPFDVQWSKLASPPNDKQNP